MSFEDRESDSRKLFADAFIHDCPRPLKLLGSLVLMVKLQLAPLSFMLLRQIRSSRVQARTGLERSLITIPDFTRKMVDRSIKASSPRLALRPYLAPPGLPINARAAPKQILRGVVRRISLRGSAECCILGSILRFGVIRPRLIHLVDQLGFSVRFRQS